MEKITGKLELMRAYYFGSEEAESFPRFLNCLLALREDLLKESLIDKSFNINSLCRVVCRCSRVISEEFHNTHLEVGISIRKIQDIYFWYNEYLPYSTNDFPLLLEIDWITIFKEIFRIKKENKDKKVEDIIPEIICEIAEYTSSIFGERKISVSEFLTFIKIYFKAKNSKEQTIESRISGCRELFSRASEFSNDDAYRRIMKGANDLKSKHCKGAPICFEGLLTTVSKSRTRTGLEKGEKLLRDLGFDKVWFRRRKSLLTYSDFISPSMLINSWGIKSFIGILSSDLAIPSSDAQDQNYIISDRLKSFIVSEFEEAIRMITSCLENTNEMVKLRNDDKTFADHYIRTQNLYRYQLLIMGYDLDFCRSYLTNSYNVEAPSDWFDEVTT